MSDRSQGMRCPIDGASLVMSERAGIEIDYCPTCRGVWLDRGELDKIVERSARERGEERRHAPRPEPRRDDRRHHGPSYGEHAHNQAHDGFGHGGYAHGQPKRRKSFLEELFD